MKSPGLLRLVVLTALLLGAIGCSEAQPPAHLRIEGGDAERGRKLVLGRYGCLACHTIDGIGHPRGVTGPPLSNFAQRALFAGSYPNAPRFLIPWLMDPPALAPRTAMPNLGISREEARDIATFLYTLGRDGVVIYPSLPAYTPERRPANGRSPSIDAADEGRAAEPTPGFVRVPLTRAMRAIVESQGSSARDGATGNGGASPP